MWIFFLTGPLLFVVAAIVHARASSRERALRHEAELEESARLEAHGRLVGGTGDSYQLTARVGEVPVTMTARQTRRIPRAKPPQGEDDEASRTVWLATVALDVGPRIVIRRLDTVHVFDREGTAMASGNAEFDRSYVTTPSAEGSAYRGASDDGTRWIGASVAQRLRDLDLLWIEAKDGTAEVAFGPLGPRSVGHAMTTVANLVRTVHGQSELPCGREPLERPGSDPVDGSAPTIIKAFAIAVVLGAPLGAAIGFIGPVHDSVAELACGPGNEVIVTSSEDDEGTSYGMECRDQTGGSVALVYMLALCIWSTLVLSGGLVFAARSWPSRLR